VLVTSGVASGEQVILDTAGLGDGARVKVQQEGEAAK
jgi:hypothetical protein